MYHRCHGVFDTMSVKKQLNDFAFLGDVSTYNVINLLDIHTIWFQIRLAILISQRDYEKLLFSMVNIGCRVFKGGNRKLERFLPKNQHTQRKLLKKWLKTKVCSFAWRIEK
jgi:hypothetical protein